MSAEALAPRPRLRGVSHQWAALLLGPVLWIVALAVAPAPIRWQMVVYAAGVTAMLTVSACYHRLPWSERVRPWVARLDYSAIYLCIAGTYTAITYLLPADSRRLVLAAVWLGAAIGIAMQWLPRRPPMWVWGPMYLVVGWTALLAGGDLLAGLGVSGFGLVLAGGLAFTVGAVVFLAKRPDPSPRWFGYHEVFHLFVLAGVAFHFAVVVGVVLPRA